MKRTDTKQIGKTQKNQDLQINKMPCEILGLQGQIAEIFQGEKNKEMARKSSCSAKKLKTRGTLDKRGLRKHPTLFIVEED